MPPNPRRLLCGRENELVKDVANVFFAHARLRLEGGDERIHHAGGPARAVGEALTEDRLLEERAQGERRDAIGIEFRQSERASVRFVPTSAHHVVRTLFQRFETRPSVGRVGQNLPIAAVVVVDTRRRIVFRDERCVHDGVGKDELPAKASVTPALERCDRANLLLRNPFLIHEVIAGPHPCAQHEMLSADEHAGHRTVGDANRVAELRLRGQNAHLALGADRSEIGCPRHHENRGENRSGGGRAPGDDAALLAPGPELRSTDDVPLTARARGKDSVEHVGWRSGRALCERVVHASHEAQRVLTVGAPLEVFGDALPITRRERAALKIGDAVDLRMAKEVEAHDVGSRRWRRFFRARV